MLFLGGFLLESFGELRKTLDKLGKKKKKTTKNDIRAPFVIEFKGLVHSHILRLSNSCSRAYLLLFIANEGVGPWSCLVKVGGFWTFQFNLGTRL